MSIFRINLIRDRPVPLPQRKSVTLPLISYLFFSGLLLAWAANQAVRDVLALRQRQRQSTADLARFSQQHPRQLDAASYIGAMRNRLVDVSECLGVTEQLLERRISVANLLFSLTTPLPRNIRVLSLDCVPSDRSLRMELAIPVEQDGGQPHASKPLSIWNDSPEVQRLVSDILEENSQQTEFGGQPSFRVRFSARIKGDH